jgi:predicted enzyme related to lactoylglutathione lyase
MDGARIWYVNLFAKDLARAVDFYRTKVGLRLRFADEKFGYASFATEGAGFAIARVDPDDPEQAGLAGRHTGVAIGVPDLQKAYEELRDRGVEFTMPPTKQPWGGVLATFRDSEGNVLYLDELRAE